ncbi:Thiamine-monophosphate kinase [Oligella sp. MSHR50489EDL]|uniref:thiamine-phosphate kinase n=1 Tax=Oligella sp. MSHR50489EDL TaxID=3139409 RepID=UPI003D815F8C
MDEFALIRQYFSQSTASITECTSYVGVGDDCAVLGVRQGEMVICKDVLIEGRHFFSDVDPFLLGHKALAVNLSDIAAMAAKPLACLLGIALPRVDAPWLEAFSRGFKRLAERYDCALVGGDTTRSEAGIFISVTALGMGRQPFPLRANAALGDDIWVSGQLGAPKIALELLLKQQQVTLSNNELKLLADTRERLEQPEPQVHLGQLLKPYIHAMIDISDGLLQDLSHILAASQLGAIVYAERLPLHPALFRVDARQALNAVLAGGDEYQLCFTAPAKYRNEIEQCALNSDSSVHRIGQITSSTELILLDAAGQVVENLPQGFNHFS